MFFDRIISDVYIIKKGANMKMLKTMITAILLTVGALGAFAQGNYQELKDKAQGLRNAQQWKDAEKVLNEALNAASNDREKSETLLLMSNCHFYSNSLDKAEQDVEKLLALKTSDTGVKAKILSRQAEIYLRTQRAGQAFKSYDEILSLPELGKADRLNAQLGKCNALMGMQKSEEATSLIEKIISDKEATPDIKANALLQKFHILESQGNKEEAKKVLEGIINSPDMGEGFKNHAKYFLKDMKKD